MRSRPSFVLCLVVLTALVAGCAGSPEAAPAGVPESVEGAIVAGKVVDDQLSPIAGATVALQDPKNLSVVQKSVSDAAGEFTFGRVPTGSHLLTVEALGFHTLSREFSVSAGQDQVLTLQLSAIPVAEAYYETVPESIHIEYGIAWSAGGDFNRGCIQPSVTCQAFAHPSANKYFWAEDPKDARLATIVLEEAWTSTSPLCAKAMAIDLYNPDAPGFTSPDAENPHYWTNYPSEKWQTSSPIVMVIPRSEDGNADAINDPGRIQRNGDDELMVRGNWTVRHFPPGAGLTNAPVDINCFTDQRFDIFWTVFYLDPAPAGFAARPV